MSHRRGKKGTRKRSISLREEKRKRGYALLRQDIPKVVIAERLGVNRKTVWDWENRMKDKGYHSWRDVRPPGRPTKLSKEQHEELKEILIKGPLARGYPTELWTLKRVAEVIKQEFGVRYNVTHIWRVLRDMGFSAQVPLKRAMERNEEYIQEWIKNEWPKIVAEARRIGATIFFIDESGIQTSPNVRRTWALRGSRPDMRIKARREKLSLISAVTVEGDLYFKIHEEDITGTDILVFLRYLLQEVPGKLMIIWDNLSIHRTKDVNELLWKNRKRVRARRLPPYAPELNPDEMVWNVVKYQELANWCPHDKDEMLGVVRRMMRKLKRHPERVKRALQGSKLPLPVGGYLRR